MLYFFLDKTRGGYILHAADIRLYDILKIICSSSPIRGETESVAGSLPNSGMVDCIWIVMVMVTVAFLSSWILRTK